MILHRGDVLFRQGESGPLYHVKSGLFKVLRLQEDGSQFLFNIIVPGEYIPHHSLISPKDYHGTAIALMTSEVEVIPGAEWYQRLAENPEQYRDVAMLLQTKLRMMQQRIDMLTAVAPIQRLELLEAWFGSYFPESNLTQVLTQEEIGQLIGVRRETVNRILKQRYST
ncbi:Crp/Fnr family transcriptional regulator [Brevibacillus dissolubilis]|uniref:Crp/Fnr family transcriptional regulator n=1 Tax=Brevibacillus dissolubilis TaxID=1844116 RepID=UPI0011176E52|nr:Crp/Fnr family transcriptional regulator [Brevibacillus dissolubilis]